jgi:hypothetical protein
VSPKSGGGLKKIKSRDVSLNTGPIKQMMFTYKMKRKKVRKVS